MEKSQRKLYAINEEIIIIQNWAESKYTPRFFKLFSAAKHNKDPVLAGGMLREQGIPLCMMSNTCLVWLIVTIIIEAESVDREEVVLGDIYRI
jgi:hypothetical protein